MNWEIYSMRKAQYVKCNKTDITKKNEFDNEKATFEREKRIENFEKK